MSLHRVEADIISYPAVQKFWGLLKEVDVLAFTSRTLETPSCRPSRLQPIFTLKEDLDRGRYIPGEFLEQHSQHHRYGCASPPLSDRDSRPLCCQQHNHNLSLHKRIHQQQWRFHYTQVLSNPSDTRRPCRP